MWREMERREKGDQSDDQMECKNVRKNSKQDIAPIRLDSLNTVLPSESG